MAQARNLAAEQEQVNKYIQVQGRAPSTADEWQTIHTAVYGTDLPNDPAIQRAWQPPATGANPQVAGAQANATATTADGKPLMYQGTNVSDTAIAGAQKAYEPWTQPNNFLDKVKERLQKKFKPETETLGLGAFSATLGALDPTGVMAGINEKTGQFRKKGALALQALSTAGDLYSEQATIALNNLSRLEGIRSDYEKEQKSIEGEMKDLALSIAKTGKQVPDDILNLLPPSQRSIYQGMSGIFAETKKSSGGGGGGGGSATGISGLTGTPDSFEDFKKNYEEMNGMSVEPTNQTLVGLYDEYKSQFGGNDEYQTYAQKYANGDINVTQLTAKFGKNVKDQILSMSADMTKAQDSNSELETLQGLLSNTDKQNMYSMGLDWNKLNDIQTYLNG